MLYAPERCVIRTRNVCYAHQNGVVYAPERCAIGTKPCAIRTRTVLYAPEWYVIRTRTVCYMHQNGVLYAPERCYRHQNGMLYAPGRCALCTRTVCYTHQNGVLYAPERCVIRTKIPSISYEIPAQIVQARFGASGFTRGGAATGSGRPDSAPADLLGGGAAHQQATKRAKVIPGAAGQIRRRRIY